MRAGAGPLPGRPTAYRLDELPSELVRDGFRRTAVRGDDTIVTVNWFDPGYRSRGPHRHQHDQLAFVLAGTLRFTVGEDAFVVEAPGVLHIPADLPHSAEPLGDARALNIDVFGPIRDDYRYLTAYQDGPDPTQTPTTDEVPAGEDHR